MPRDRSRYRDRRSSSYSSESSYERKKTKSKHKKRSRSRDRSESSSYRRKRSTSRSKHKRRSYSRSVSRERDRYESKSKRRSTSRSRSKRDRSRSRSESRSKSKYSKSSNKKSSKRSRSSTRSSSYEKEYVNPNKFSLDDTDTKLEKAIKAAEAAGLTMTKIPTYEYKEVEVKEDMPTIQDRNLLAELNNDSFVQKPFVSSRNKKHSQNIVIDLNSETVTVPETGVKVQADDSIIDFNQMASEEELREMWIKKLYNFRKKMLKGEL